MSNSKDIEEVRISELTRNLHYNKEKAKKRTKELREIENIYKNLLQGMKFKDVIRALELQPGTVEYDEFFQTWIEYRQDLVHQKKARRKRQP